MKQNLRQFRHRLLIMMAWITTYSDKGRYPHRSMAMAHTSLERAKMWTGNCIALLPGEETPYPSASDPKAIPPTYDTLESLRENDPDGYSALMAYSISVPPTAPGDGSATLLYSCNDAREKLKTLSDEIYRLTDVVMEHGPLEDALKNAWKYAVEARNDIGMVLAEIREAQK